MSPAQRRVACANLDAIRVATLAVAVFVLSLVVVVQYADQLDRVNWPLVCLLAMLILGGYSVYRWNATSNRYNVLDLLVDHDSGRANIWKHFALAGFALSVWVIVQAVLAKQPVGEMLLGVLGIFVGKVALDGFSRAMERRPAAPESPNIGVLNQSQAAAPAPAPVQPLGPLIVPPKE